MLLPAVVTITLALVFYSVGVWGEHLQKILKWWHIVFFALGLTADAAGTLMMSSIAGQRRAQGVPATWLDTVMAWTGVLAILLMAVHLAWAIVVRIRNRQDELQSFHRFSLAVWAIWLVPYTVGAVSAMVS